MGRLIAKPAARKAAARRGLLLPVETAVEQPQAAAAAPAPEQAPAPEDRRINRHLLSLDLRLRWPRVFCEPPVPLAIGTGQALADLLIIGGGEYQVDDLREVLTWWTNRPDYLAAVVAGRARVDLSGQGAGFPTAAERAFAAAKLAKTGGGR